MSQPRPCRGARGRRGAARTGFNFLDDGAAAAVPHLPDVQQVVGVPVVRGPEVDENAGPAAPAVHHHPVIKGRVLGVRGRQLLRPRQVPAAQRLSTGGLAPAAGVTPLPAPSPAHLSSRREARGGAAQRRGTAAASSSSSPKRRANPSTAGRCRGPGHGPTERHDRQKTPTLRVDTTAEYRQRTAPGPEPPARPHSPGHVRPLPPARASPLRVLPPAPADTSPAAAAAAPHQRSPAPRATAANRLRPPCWSHAHAARRPIVLGGTLPPLRAGGGGSRLRPCSCVRPSPGGGARRLPANRGRPNTQRAPTS